MVACIYRGENGQCLKFTDNEYTSWCGSTPCEFATPSYGDKLRSMSDDKLADEILDMFAAFYAVEWSKEDILELLKRPAEDVCAESGQEGMLDE